MSFQSSYPQVLFPATAQPFWLEAPSQATKQVLDRYEERVQEFQKIQGVKRSLAAGIGTWALLSTNPVTAPIAVAGLVVAGGITAAAFVRKVTSKTVEQVPVYRTETLEVPARRFSDDHFVEGNAARGKFDDLFWGDVAPRLRDIHFCGEGIAISSVSRLNYYPDLLIYTQQHFLIDVEIDEPWFWRDGQKVLAHDADVDAVRNQSFLREGIVVIRLSEQQVVLQTEACFQLIQSVIDHLHAQGGRDRSPLPTTAWRGQRQSLYTDHRRLQMSRPDRSSYRGLGNTRSD
ncbi:hypothetical protein VZG28_06335 [Synechococcus elongatus IITB4]|uniref:hypothetical protein n=1 Tax=Synechococcus elongatus TaxID=32046 RepID=UPI0030D28C9E